MKYRDIVSTLRAADANRIVELLSAAHDVDVLNDVWVKLFDLIEFLRGKNAEVGTQFPSDRTIQ